MSCGGCRGQGAHARWCPTIVGPRAARLARLAQRADTLGDQIGGNCPAAANSAYATAGHLYAAAVVALAEHGAEEERHHDAIVRPE